MSDLDKTLERLDILNDDELLDLGAQLELDFSEAKTRYANLLARRDDENRRLIKPGVKLATNAALAVAGISLTPFTWGLSLFLTFAGSVMVISDGYDFSGDVSGLRSSRREMARLKREMADTIAQLEAINILIDRRVNR